jgi:hypothetical protein
MAAPDIKKYNFYILSVKKNSICKSTKIITQMYICIGHFNKNVCLQQIYVLTNH